MVKILFDAYTPPDIQLYTSIGGSLEKRGISVHYIVPHNEECIDIINKKRVRYQIVGPRSSRGFLSKALANLLRMVILIKYIYKIKADIVISRSVATPFAARLLRKKAVMFIDNDAAVFALLLTLPLATRIYMPKAIKLYGAIPKSIKRKTLFYKGIEEQIYLDYKINEDIYEVLDLSRDKGLVVVRPFGLKTEYHRKEEDTIENILKNITRSNKIMNKNHIILLPRTEEQKRHYRKLFGSSIVIPQKPLDGQSLLAQSDILIGAGGTMLREAWVMGNTVFSLYSGKQLSVERWLASQKNYYKNFDMTKIKRPESRSFSLNTSIKKLIINDLIKIIYNKK